MKKSIYSTSAKSCQGTILKSFQERGWHDVSYYQHPPFFVGYKANTRMFELCKAGLVDKRQKGRFTEYRLKNQYRVVQEGNKMNVYDTETVFQKIFKSL